MIWLAPSTARVENQTIITGPNTRPRAAVPRRCTMNSAVSTTTARGTTNRSRSGAATVVPSMAASTEMAGVITPSP